jgi:hypothetical protein
MANLPARLAKLEQALTPARGWFIARVFHNDPASKAAALEQLKKEGMRDQDVPIYLIEFRDQDFPLLMAKEAAAS